MTYSRFDADLFTRNLHYATSWWNENCYNFEGMIEKLIKEEPLKIMATDCCRITLTFNAKTRWIDYDYNSNVIQDAYVELVKILGTEKIFIFTFADAYMSWIDLFKAEFSESEMPGRNNKDIGQSPELLRIKKLFYDHADQVIEECELYKCCKRILGQNFDFGGLIKYFLPQLILLFLRFFDLYDSSMMGCSVEERLELINKCQNPQAESTEEEQYKNILSEKFLKNFGKPEFWEKRYEKIESNFDPYEWYVNWDSLSSQVASVTGLQKKEKINVLDLGCGISSLAEDLISDPNFKNVISVVSIDANKKVIDAQSQRLRSKIYKDKLIYKYGNSLDLSSYPEASFDLVVDKGTFDSILMSSSALDNFYTYCKQVSRIIKPQGYYIIVSCAIGLNQIKPLQNLTEYKWIVQQVSELPANVNQEIQIHVLFIRKLDDDETQKLIDEQLKTIRAVMNFLVKEKGIEDHWIIDSAGTSRFNIGCSPDTRTVQVCKKLLPRCPPITHKARQIKTADYLFFDYILCMDTENFESALEMAPEKRKSNILKLGYFDPDKKKECGTTIRDTYYDGDSLGFEKNFELIYKSLENFIEKSGL